MKQQGQHAPIWVDPAPGVWLLLRFDDVEEGLSRITGVTTRATPATWTSLIIRSWLTLPRTAVVGGYCRPSWYGKAT